MDKAVNTTHVRISPPLLEATSTLAENLTGSEAFHSMQDAEGRLKANADAQKILSEFSQLKKTIRAQEHSGAAAENDIQRLRELQNLIGVNATIHAAELTRGNAVELVREVNREISKLIGIDFATLARHPGGCC